MSTPATSSPRRSDAMNLPKTPRDLADVFNARNACYTGKVKYSSQLDAAIALFKLQTQKEGRNEQRAYPCQDHWHLTSMPLMGSKGDDDGD